MTHPARPAPATRAALISPRHRVLLSPGRRVAASLNRRVFNALALATALAILALIPGCKARKDFPEPNIGSHTPNFDVIFGRLVRVPARDPDGEPTWLLRFGYPHDPYQGEMALTDLKKPSTFALGYSGGEPVEIHGHLLNQSTADSFNGRWYVVDSIQLWSGYRE